MVVCKCRKATKLYCFVHKIPVCNDCIGLAEHRRCMVGSYSDWVNDGDYDWPPKCIVCSSGIEESDTSTARLGCLHLMHEACLETHLSSFPPHTAPAGYVCPACSVPIWPPKSQRDAASTLYTMLRTLIAKSSASSVLLGTAVPASSASAPPPAFAGPPLVAAGGGGDASASTSAAAPGVSAAGVPLRQDGSTAPNGVGGPSTLVVRAPEYSPNSAFSGVGAAKANGLSPQAGAGGGDGKGGAPGEAGLGAAAAGGAPPSSPGPPSSHGAPKKPSAAATAPPQQQQQHGQGAPQQAAMPRKNSMRDRVAVDITEDLAPSPHHPHHHHHHHEHHNTYTDDEDNERKYARKGRRHYERALFLDQSWVPREAGSAYRQVLQQVGAMWSPALQVLPVTSKPRDREGPAGDEGGDSSKSASGLRRRQQQLKKAAMDPRKLLLIIAIL
eukprot:jgi/Mesen1/6599/ME000338S05774